MTFESFRKNAYDLFRANSARCLDYLLEYLCHDSTQFDIVNNLCRQHALRKAMHIEGSLSNAEFLAQTDAIFAKLNGVLGSLEEKDIEFAVAFKKAIHDKILVVARNDKALKDTRPFFLPERFPQAIFITHDQMDNNLRAVLADYRLLIVTNMYDLADDYDDWIQKVADEAGGPIFYFGQFKSWVNDFPNEIYASNSRFSLESRIKELLEYLDEHYKDCYCYPYFPNL